MKAKSVLIKSIAEHLATIQDLRDKLDFLTSYVEGNNVLLILGREYILGDAWVREFPYGCKHCDYYDPPHGKNHRDDCWIKLGREIIATENR